MWIVVSATSATWTASLLAMVASGGTARGNIATTASHQGTGMAMTATADLSTALQAIIIGRTEEVGHQLAIPPITVDNSTRVPASRCGVRLTYGSGGYFAIRRALTAPRADPPRPLAPARAALLSGT